MFIPNLNEPFWFLIITIALFAIIIGRYFLIAGLFYGIFYVWQKEKWQSHKINKQSYKAGQFQKEMKRSILSGGIFSIFGTAVLWLWQNGYTKIYDSFNSNDWWWIPLSCVITLIIHETYYYWLHRWMHHPKVFRVVHQWHHDSKVASPWTAFSFHPIETVIQAIFFPLLVLILPLHVYLLLFLLVIMSISSVINHLDIEIYPIWFIKSRIGKAFIGSTHHSLHHKQFKYNFGLYFTWWDVAAKTESPLMQSVGDKQNQ